MLVDFYILVFQMLPIAFRQDLLLRIFGCLIEPLQQMHDEFHVFANEYRTKAVVNSQVWVLQDYLRTFFGTEQIFLLDGSDIEMPIVYHEIENRQNLIVYHDNEPIAIGNIVYNAINPIIYHNAEDDSVDCIIQCPVFLEPKQNQIKAILREYLFADKTHKIIYV